MHEMTPCFLPVRRCTGPGIPCTRAASLHAHSHGRRAEPLAPASHVVAELPTRRHDVEARPVDVHEPTDSKRRQRHIVAKYVIGPRATDHEPGGDKRTEAVLVAPRILDQIDVEPAPGMVTSLDLTKQTRSTTDDYYFSPSQKMNIVSA